MLRRFSSPIRAELLKAVLEEHFIPAIVLNKRDTSYDSFGTVELYVPETYRERAEEILVAEDQNPETDPEEEESTTQGRIDPNPESND